MRWLPALALLALPLLVRAQEKRPVAAGRDVYAREACWECHVQDRDRRFPAPTGTRRSGPVLGATPLPRSREWHRAHFHAPRALVAESQMPAYRKHFTPHPNAAEVAAFVARHDADGDGIVTRAEYERGGGADWAGALARLDTGNEVVSGADAVPRASPELESLIDYLVSFDPPPATARPVPERPAGDREAAVARGERLYLRHCAGCHGARADGNGVAAPFFLDHPPRNFSRGEFKFRSTLSPEPPLDADLFRTIRWGTGASMPAWPRLSDRQVWDLVEFVKSNHPLYLPHELFVEQADGETLHSFTLDTEESDASGVELGNGRILKRAGKWWWLADGRETPLSGRVELEGRVVRLGRPVFAWLTDFEPRPVEVPAPPFPYTATSAATGAKVYQEFGCAACHGPTGKGDGPDNKKFRGSLGEILRPTDYSRGPLYLKGGADARSLVRAFFTGLQGTAMPSYLQNFTGTEAAPPDAAPWHLAHFVMRQAGIPFE